MEEWGWIQDEKRRESSPRGLLRATKCASMSNAWLAGGWGVCGWRAGALVAGAVRRVGLAVGAVSAASVVRLLGSVGKDVSAVLAEG